MISADKVIVNILVGLTFVLQQSSFAEIKLDCKIIAEPPLTDIKTVNEFDLNQAFSGYGIQFCINKNDGDATITRVGEILDSQNVSLVVKQQVCSAPIEFELIDVSGLDVFNKLEFDCEVSRGHSFMCFRSENSCTVEDVNNFVLTDHVNVYQFGSIAHDLDEIATRNPSEEVEKFTSLSEESKNNLRKICESDDPLRLLLMGFHDYSSFVYSGKINVIARQGLILYVFIFRVEENGPLLEKVSVAVE